MACPSCGSWAVKADRALAGRMVCARCGHVLGLRGSAPGPSRRRRPAFGRPKRWRLWLGLTSLVGVSTVLAAQGPVADRLNPPPRSPFILEEPAGQRGLGM
ncbi:MAG: hypothetical protein RLZZ117_2720 [Cyanobacteriota bacterium]|jgi:hypothetical protein